MGNPEGFRKSPSRKSLAEAVKPSPTVAAEGRSGASALPEEPPEPGELRGAASPDVRDVPGSIEPESPEAPPASVARLRDSQPSSAPLPVVARIPEKAPEIAPEPVETSAATDEQEPRRAPRSLPPVDPTSPASDEVPGAHDFPVPMVSVRRPFLASEALMEDLAPVEPARQAARIWLTGVGAASVLFGALPAAGALPGGVSGAIPWWFTGATALVAAGVPVTYRRRAIAMVVLGLLSSVVALQGVGGLLLTADGGGPWALARLVAAVSLPAALLFRARYRAFRGARIILGAAFGLSLPLAVHAAMTLMGPGGLPTLGAVLVLLTLAGGLSGFMGSETTGAGAALGPATMAIVGLDLALRGVSREIDGSGALNLILGAATAAVAFAGASALAATGLFQLLASRFAAEARRIDLHPPPVTPAAPETPSDWSTRE